MKNIIIVDGSEDGIKYKKMNQELTDLVSRNVRKASSVKDALGIFKDGVANGTMYYALVVCEILPDKDIDRIKEMKAINPNLFVVLVYDYYDSTRRYDFDYFIKYDSKNPLVSNERLGEIRIALGKYHMLYRKKNYPCDIRDSSSCRTCMLNAPYPYCCKDECGDHSFCDGCDYRKNDYKNDARKPAIDNSSGLLLSAYKFAASLDDEYQKNAFDNFVAQLMLYVDHVAYDYRVHTGIFADNNKR